MKYPPYTDLCLIGFAGVQESQVRDAAGRFLADLQGLATREYADVPMIALDPTPAAVARAAGKYRYKLLIKTVNFAPAGTGRPASDRSESEAGKQGADRLRGYQSCGHALKTIKPTYTVYRRSARKARTERMN